MGDFPLMAWAIFLGVILLMLALDLFVLHRNPHEIRFKEALLGACAPVALACIFAGLIYFAYDRHWLGLGIIPPGVLAADPSALDQYPDTGLEALVAFVTGYIVELSLSADNVLLFILLMGAFAVPRAYQHRVLFWGVLGALVMRGAMIVGLSELIERFHVILYFFGCLLIFSGLKLLWTRNQAPDMTNSLTVRLAKRFIPVTPEYHGPHFFALINGKRFATPLLLVLVTIELMDLVFAVDSIPAVFAVTRDAFIVFTSNVFAILGLRSLYFLLSGVMDRFRYLKVGLSIVLVFVGIKMLLPLGNMRVRSDVSLGIIVAVLAVSMAWGGRGGRVAKDVTPGKPGAI
jgi:tellurite resistance protein TerC